MKKAKLKRKNDEQVAAVITSLKEDNRQLLEMLKKTNSDKQQALEIQNRNIALKEFKEENKILLQDLSSIADPNIRAYIQAQQARILQRRVEQQQPPPPPPSASNVFGQYFNDIEGTGTDLPEY